jgi:5-methylcytosine-specific restriction endonuclease McrA
VFARDGGRCTFTAKDGTKCQSTRGVQIDHIVPYAAGGTHDPANLRLLCAAHNRRAAEMTLGSRVMQPYWRPA